MRQPSMNDSESYQWIPIPVGLDHYFGATSTAGENREVVQRLMRLTLRKPKDMAVPCQEGEVKGWTVIQWISGFFPPQFVWSKSSSILQPLTPTNTWGWSADGPESGVFSSGLSGVGSGSTWKRPVSMGGLMGWFQVWSTLVSELPAKKD